MKKNALLLFALFALIAIGCSSDDDSTTSASTAAAFVNQSANLTAADNAINIVFSTPTSAAGTVTLNVIPTNVVYGTDFTTNPAAVSNTITVAFAAGVSAASFTFTKLIDALEGQVKNVKFEIRFSALA